MQAINDGDLLTGAYHDLKFTKEKASANTYSGVVTIGADLAIGRNFLGSFDPADDVFIDVVEKALPRKHGAVVGYKDSWSGRVTYLYAYSENLGWINLQNGQVAKTGHDLTGQWHVVSVPD